MSREAVKTLMDKWMNDPAFRDELRKDPEAAVRRTGVELEPDEWAAVRVIDWNTSDEELASRANKLVCCI